MTDQESFTQAMNYEMLFEAGSKAQAERLAENMSLWKTQDWKEGSTIFGFEDGSAIYACGSEFRRATLEEIATAK